jgi:hypothetical protein
VLERCQLASRELERFAQAPHGPASWLALAALEALDAADAKPAALGKRFLSEPSLDPALAQQASEASLSHAASLVRDFEARKSKSRLTLPIRVFGATLTRDAAQVAKRRPG